MTLIVVTHSQQEKETKRKKFIQPEVIMSLPELTSSDITHKDVNLQHTQQVPSGHGMDSDYSQCEGSRFDDCVNVFGPVSRDSRHGEPDYRVPSGAHLTRIVSSNLVSSNLDH